MNKITIKTKTCVELVEVEIGKKTATKFFKLDQNLQKVQKYTYENKRSAFKKVNTFLTSVTFLPADSLFRFRRKLNE